MNYTIHIYTSLYSTIDHIVTVDSLSPALDPLTWENQ